MNGQINYEWVRRVDATISHLEEAFMEQSQLLQRQSQQLEEQSQKIEEQSQQLQAQSVQLDEQANELSTVRSWQLVSITIAPISFNFTFFSKNNCNIEFSVL